MSAGVETPRVELLKVREAFHLVILSQARRPGRCRDLTGSTYVQPDTVKRKSRPRLEQRKLWWYENPLGPVPRVGSSPTPGTIL